MPSSLFLFFHLPKSLIMRSNHYFGLGIVKIIKVIVGFKKFMFIFYDLFWQFLSFEFL